MTDYVRFLGNHLWQSTAFAAGVFLMTRFLRNNRAAVRSGLWLAASIKFLIPFALLTGLGMKIEWRTAPTSGFDRPAISIERGDFSEPRMNEKRPVPANRARPDLLPAIWACGFLTVLVVWFKRWREVRSQLANAKPIDVSDELRAFLVPSRMEPGVFGVFRPVLLLPSGIRDYLTGDQFEAVVAHELCHVQRRDNLAAAIHRFVEALFWFHPMVWWIGRRMMIERERACDEAVLSQRVAPATYAEGILNVCRFYIESPLHCASSVTGGGLKSRIEEIMSHRVGERLTPFRKFVLAGSAILLFAGPFVLGVMNAPALRAQEPPAHLPSFEVASVKPGQAQHMQLPQFLPGGRFVASAPLSMIVAAAYNVGFVSPRLTGSGADWKSLEGSIFEIEAKAPEGAIPSGAPSAVRAKILRSMLQSLLAERFHLKIRMETKELPAYVMVPAKGGLKLQKAKIEEKDCDTSRDAGWGITCHTFQGGMGRGLHGQAVSTGDIAEYVENWSDRPLVDRTGAQGLFNVQTDGWAPLRQRPANPDGPTAEDRDLLDPTRLTLFMMFEKQLGIKLEAQKAPVDTLIVEHVEKPAAN